MITEDVHHHYLSLSVAHTREIGPQCVCPAFRMMTPRRLTIEERRDSGQTETIRYGDHRCLFCGSIGQLDRIEKNYWGACRDHKAMCNPRLSRAGREK